MQGKAVQLVSNAGAGNGADVQWNGGKSVFIADATFGGGSVKLQCKTELGNYFDVANGSLTAAGMVTLELPAGVYRAVVTTATAASAKLVSIPI